MQQNVAGTAKPACARYMQSEIDLRNVDLPAILGPVISNTLFSFFKSFHTADFNKG